MKRVFCVILTALLMCIGLAGCSIEVEERENSEGPAFYYYSLSDDETELVREVYEPSEQTFEVMVQELLQFYERRNPEGRNSNLLPEEVAVNSFDLKDSVLVLDFSSKYSSMSRSREALVRLGIVKTFLQVPNVVGVKFTIQGNDLTNSKNEPIGKMTADTFVELSDEFDTYRYETFSLYFTDKDGKNLVEERRSVYYKRTLQRERVVLEQLAKGPMIKGNYPTISESTDVLDITIADRVCYVDLSKSFIENDLGVSSEIAVYSIVNSLMDKGDIDKVQIMVDGSSEYTWSDGLSLYSFYEMNKKLVQKGES